MAFNTLGATPNNINNILGPSKSMGGSSTPQTSGILPISSGSIKPASYYDQSIGNLQGILNRAEKTGAVKSVTMNNSDGSSHKVDYHNNLDNSNKKIDNSKTSTENQNIDQSKNTFKPDAQGNNTVGNNPGMINVGGTQNTSTPAPTYDQTNPQLYGQITTGLANTAGDNTSIGQNAADIAAKTGQQISDIGQKGAGLMAGQLTTGTSPVAEGNAAITANTIAQQQLAAERGGQMALTGTGQQLTGQAQKQTALNQAGGLAAPQAYSPTQAPYNPITQTFPSGANQTQRAIGGANITSAQDLTQQSNTLKATLGGADANFKLLIDTAKQGGVNDNNVPMLNLLTQNVQRGLASSSAVTNFRATLQEVRNQYATILGGGSATDMSRTAANDQIPDDISLGALQSLYGQMTSAANNRIAGIDNQVKTLSNQGTQSNTSKSGNSLYSF